MDGSTGDTSGDHDLLGFARVRLSDLHCDSQGGTTHRRLAPATVSRLVRIFRSHPPLRGEERHFVEAVLDDKDVSAVKQSAAVLPSAPSALQLQTLPILQGYRLRCLNGWHRLQAARRCLNENDQWWVVKIYSRGECAMV